MVDRGDVKDRKGKKEIEVEVLEGCDKWWFDMIGIEDGGWVGGRGCRDIWCKV